MAERKQWSDGVRIVRGKSLAEAMRHPSTGGRATAFDFASTGSRGTWIGTVILQPNAMTGAHHHGRHEVAIYVIGGRSEIRWGERLEYVTDVEPGDFVYFAPYVPHQERNPSASEAVQFLVVRTDNERIVVTLDTVPTEQPQAVS
jgi:uncharacterized RmlC-like cupin family protein